MKKKNIFMKKLRLLCLTGMIAITTLTGCGNQKKLVFTTGLSGDQLFKIGKEVCTRQEAMIYLTTFYNQYIDIYGEEIWNHDFGGVTLEEHVKETVLSKLVQIKLMNLMAKERKITPSAEEKEALEEAAGSYLSKISEALAEKENINADTVTKVFEEYALANRVYETIIGSAETEISDDEARTVTVKEIYLKNWKLENGEQEPLSQEELLKTLETAKDLVRRIQEGEDFTSLAQQFSEEKQIEKSYGRNQTEQVFEETVFSLDEGEVSHVIETGDGYHIVQCISTMDEEATRKNKTLLAEQRKQEAFSEAYEQTAQSMYSEFREEAWKEIMLDSDLYRTEADFFKIYKEACEQ